MLCTGGGIAGCLALRSILNALTTSATPLPIKLVNVWDPVWIRGTMDCPAPAFVPWFGHSCVHFTYRLEEEVDWAELDAAPAGSFQPLMTDGAAPGPRT